MAQESWNRESDGTGYKAPESHRLCANNCGFFGSPATLDLCSKCYRDHRLKEEHASSAKAAVEKSLKASAAPVTNQASATFSAVQCSEACWTYRVPVSLWPDVLLLPSLPGEHKCEYDYKTHGKDLIRKDNPVVKAEKLEKI